MITILRKSAPVRVIRLALPLVTILRKSAPVRVVRRPLQ